MSLAFPKTRPIDEAGNFTNEWRMFFLSIYERIGGALGGSIGDGANDLSPLPATPISADDVSPAMQPQSSASDLGSDPRIDALMAMVAELSKAIQDLRQGVTG